MIYVVREITCLEEFIAMQLGRGEGEIVSLCELPEEDEDMWRDWYEEWLASQN